MSKLKLEIDVTERDCQDLMSGEKFEWTWLATDGKTEVDVVLFNSDYMP